MDTDEDGGLDLAWDLCLELATIGGHSVMVEQRAADASAPDGSTLFVASTDDEDRAMDVVRQDWRLRNFRRNGVILDNHNRSRVVGRSLMAKVPKKGADAGKLLIRVGWDLQSPDVSIRVVGDQHLNGFRNAGSVGFRHGKRTERSKLPESSPYHRLPIEVETWYGKVERSGTLYEQNELMEFSSATIPMNPEAVARALGMDDPGAQLAERLGELDGADLERRLAVLGQSLRAEIAADMRATLPGMLADESTRSAVLELLIPDIKARMRSDREFRAIVEGYRGAGPPADTAPVWRTVPGADPSLDFLFQTSEPEGMP